MPPSPTPSVSTPQALLASTASEASLDSASTWYPDFGASNHITNNFSHFSLPSIYSGSDSIHMADGIGIAINHVGNAKVHASSTSLSLSNLLHVLLAHKNLLSVSKFTQDNRVFLEFHSDYFVVKCQDTNRIILRGVVKDGLYLFITCRFTLLHLIMLPLLLCLHCLLP